MQNLASSNILEWQFRAQASSASVTGFLKMLFTHSPKATFPDVHNLIWPISKHSRRYGQTDKSTNSANKSIRCDSVLYSNMKGVEGGCWILGAGTVALPISLAQVTAKVLLISKTMQKISHVACLHVAHKYSITYFQLSGGSTKILFKERAVGGGKVLEGLSFNKL